MKMYIKVEYRKYMLYGQKQLRHIFCFPQEKESLTGLEHGHAGE